MQQKTKEAIEVFLKKSGFWKVSGKEKWLESKVPHMKVVSLEGDIPDVYLSTGTSRQEAEDCGLVQMEDIKTFVMNIYNKEEESIKKPSGESDSHKSGSMQEVSHHSPPITPNESETPAPGGESHTEEELPFICSACKIGISAEQRTATMKSCKRALCIACSQMPAKEEPESTKEIKKDESKTKKKTKNPLPQQITEPITPVMCKGCGIELSHIRALEYIVCEDCAEKSKIAAETIVPLRSREFIKEQTMTEKPDPKEIIPAAKPGANTPMSDHERELIIEKAKTKRYLEGQGGSFKVNGNEIPDSAQIQNVANEAGISIEILESEQNSDYARVRVRGKLGYQYVDGEVWVDFETETQLLMMEFINKNKTILDRWDGFKPVLKEGAQIKNFDGTFSDAKYALVHAMLTQRKFAIRTAATKASNIVQRKLLNKEFRDKEEISDEQAEKDLVQNQRRK